SESDRGRRDRALPREPDRLQGTAFRRVPAGAAEEQRRQSPAARAEGERGGSEPERARGEVERYADESADERPVHADELQIAADVKLDPRSRRPRVPLLDRLRHDRAQAVAVVLDQVDQDLLQPQVQPRAYLRVLDERTPDAAHLPLEAEPERGLAVGERLVQVRPDPAPQIADVSVHGWMIEKRLLQRAAPLDQGWVA